MPGTAGQLPPSILALEDGSLFSGVSIGADGVSTGEVVFNTALTGYQEILTDPSYAQQFVTLTYPHIGNVGTNEADAESGDNRLSGLVIREVPRTPSNFRNEVPLIDYMKSRGVLGIAGIDTRRLTRILRDKGAQRGCLMSGRIDADEAVKKAREFKGLQGANLAREVTTQDVYQWSEPTWRGASDNRPQPDVANAEFHCVVIDCGVKRNILRLLVEHGCRVTVVPLSTTADDIRALNPDGVMVSNGPGDPEPCEDAIATTRALMDAGVPVMGICLGHQILALACGAKTVKMKFGHHGANHPVQDLDSGRVLISSQNHGFAVEEASLPDNVRAIHRSLFDGSLQGIERTDVPAFGFQGHPEASPGPHDVSPLFERFATMMREAKG